jgi:hypothetical protein
MAEHPSYQRQGGTPLFLSHLMDTHVGHLDQRHRNEVDPMMAHSNEVKADRARRAEEEGKDLWVIGPRRIATLSRKFLYASTHAPVPDFIEKQPAHKDDPEENHWIVDKGPSVESHEQAQLKITCAAPKSTATGGSCFHRLFRCNECVGPYM